MNTFGLKNPFLGFWLLASIYFFGFSTGELDVVVNKKFYDQNLFVLSSGWITRNYKANNRMFKDSGRVPNNANPVTDDSQRDKKFFFSMIVQSEVNGWRSLRR